MILDSLENPVDSLFKLLKNYSENVLVSSFNQIDFFFKRDLIYEEIEGGLLCLLTMDPDSFFILNFEELFLLVEVQMRMFLEVLLLSNLKDNIFF